MDEHKKQRRMYNFNEISKPLAWTEVTLVSKYLYHRRLTNCQRQR